MRFIVKAINMWAETNAFRNLEFSLGKPRQTWTEKENRFYERFGGTNEGLTVYKSHQGTVRV